MSNSKTAARLVPAGFFVWRAPRLPFDELPRDASELRELFGRADVRDALFVASPALEERLAVWQCDPASESGRKIGQSLVRYAARMVGRSTPFGLFAGCGVGRIGAQTRLAAGDKYRRHTRLDMDYVVALTNALVREPELRPALRFFPNSSLYQVAGRARYLEVRAQDKGWSHHRISLEVPDYLQVILTHAARGATPAELAHALLDHDPEAGQADADEYVNNLIDAQVLVSELTPCVTGREPIHALIEQLSLLPAAALAVEELTRVRDELARIDDGGAGAPPARYRDVAKRIAALPAPVDESRLFQVDLVHPAQTSTLGDNVVAEIVRGVWLLHRIAAEPGEGPLSAFRQAFTARYGHTPVTRGVPLAEALDDETGVGFGLSGEAVEASSLLEGLEISAPVDPRVAWRGREIHLLQLLTAGLGEGRDEIELKERDLERLAAENPLPFPDSFAALVRLEATSDEALARGDFRMHLASAIGPSGARLLGRFCHADPALAERVEEYLQAEEARRPDAIFAEVVHLPEGRLGNILARPAWRGYEIPYLSRSSLPAERQIPISDLRVSVEGPRVVLRSVRLGREVIPRLTSAHNYSTGRGIYQFLCAFQHQGICSTLSWTWGPLESSAYLPRVVCGRIVLARAQWSISNDEIATLKAAANTQHLEAVSSLRERRRLPRWVCLDDGDNELPIDLDNGFMAEMLVDQLKSRKSARFTEVFPAPDQLCVRGETGRFVHELVVPFHTHGQGRAPIQRESSGRVRADIPRSRRVFVPGSEWLTVKLYAGSITVDHLVRDVVGPLAAELAAAGIIRRWFFTRYADPHSHLRLRFLAEPAVLQSTVLPAVHAAIAPLVADGRIWKSQLDTYEREVERYGGAAGIELCEQLFQYDSEAVVAVLQSLEDDSRCDRRWRLAMLGMDRLLGDLGLNLDSKCAVLRASRDGFRREFRLDHETTKKLGDKHRGESEALARLIGSRKGIGHSAAHEEFARRSHRNAGVIAQLHIVVSDLEGLAANLLHMHVNRLLRSGHRAQEMVLYDFLHRHCEQLRGRLRGQQTDQSFNPATLQAVQR